MEVLRGVNFGGNRTSDIHAREREKSDAHTTHHTVMVSDRECAPKRCGILPTNHRPYTPDAVPIAHGKVDVCAPLNILYLYAIGSRVCKASEAVIDVSCRVCGAVSLGARVVKVSSCKVHSKVEVVANRMCGHVNCVFMYPNNWHTKLWSMEKIIDSFCDYCVYVCVCCVIICFTAYGLVF